MKTNLLLLSILSIPWLIFYFAIPTTQIVILAHPEPEMYKIVPKSDFWILPVAILLIFSYNLVLATIFETATIFKRLNIFVVAINLIIWAYLFYLNF
jgi:hypothetical protein